MAGGRRGDDSARTRRNILISTQLTTASTLSSAKGSAVAEPCSSVASLPRFFAAASSCAWSESTPITDAPGQQSSASAKKVALPQKGSKTTSPGFICAACATT